MGQGKVVNAPPMNPRVEEGLVALIEFASKSWRGRQLLARQLAELTDRTSMPSQGLWKSLGKVMYLLADSIPLRCDEPLNTNTRAQALLENGWEPVLTWRHNGGAPVTEQEALRQLEAIIGSGHVKY